MFFGVRSALGASAMAALKVETGGNMVWVEQGTGYLSESWEDECFEWTHEYDSGVNYSDPFNLAAVTAPYSTIRQSGKKTFGAMCGNFNGTLTKSVSWSMGKYLPSSNGLCVVERAAAINSAIFNNMTRMQWTTWSDWEEGTQVESGIENNFALTGQFNSPDLLSWTITAGDERTIDHYEVYASTNGVNAAFLGSVPTGLHQTNLSQVGLAPGSYQLYVDAVGKPCIRDHMSPPVPAVLSASPVLLSDVQPLYQRVWQGDPVSLAVVAGGMEPLSYQWTLNGQNIAGATNSNYSFQALTGTNYYAITVGNGQGSANSSTGAVVGVAATFLNPSNYYAMPITFSGYTNGELDQLSGAGAPEHRHSRVLIFAVCLAERRRGPPVYQHQRPGVAFPNQRMESGRGVADLGAGARDHEHQRSHHRALGQRGRQRDAGLQHQRNGLDHTGQLE